MQRSSDIRTWLSPPRMDPPQPATPSPMQQRRRRVIVTDDSDESEMQRIPSEAPRDITSPQVPPSPQAARPSAAPAPIMEHVDVSESDDMYIPLPHPSRHVVPSEQPAHQERQRTAPPAPPSANRKRAPVRATPPSNNSRNTRRRLEAEAVESSLDDDDSSECVESDTNAQQLYREAILGVRNARNERSIMKIQTMPCKVCSLFAQYLQHFIHD